MGAEDVLAELDTPARGRRHYQPVPECAGVRLGGLWVHREFLKVWAGQTVSLIRYAGTSGALSGHAAALDAESLVVNLEINRTPEELLVRALRARGFGVLGVGDGRAAMSSTTDVGLGRSAFSTHLESLTFRKVLRIVLRERDRGLVARGDLAPTAGAALEAYLDALITDRYLTRTRDPDVWAVTE